MVASIGDLQKGDRYLYRFKVADGARPDTPLDAIAAEIVG